MGSTCSTMEVVMMAMAVAVSPLRCGSITVGSRTVGTITIVLIIR